VFDGGSDPTVIAFLIVGTQRLGIRPTWQVAPSYDAAVVLSLGAVSTVVIWFAAAATLGAEAAARQTARALQLAEAEAQHSAATFRRAEQILDEEPRLELGEATVEPNIVRMTESGYTVTVRRGQELKFGPAEEERSGE
jgi:hypothetical protein